MTIWIAVRCPKDIAFATHFLSRGVSAPTATHIAAAIHLHPYLRDTGSRHSYSHGLLLRIHNCDDAPATRDELIINHDVTFAGDPIDASSVAAVVVFLNGTPVDWHVKRIAYVARSSTDGEL